jgi:ATP-dependent DNA helicase RecG
VSEEAEIRRLLGQPEGQFLERKSCYDRSSGRVLRRRPAEVARDVAETLAAFANADGGTLLLGVEDDGALTGVDFPHDKLSLLETAPQRLVRPPLRPNLARWSSEGRTVWAFSIPWLPTVHQLHDGRYILRMGAANVPFPADQIEALKAAKRRALAEAEIRREATLEDLDLDLVRDAARRIGVEEDIEAFLRRYRLLEWENGNARLKLAALLLFGSDPLRWHPRCGIDFVKYEGTEREHGARLNIVKRERLEAPLVRLVEGAYRAIAPHVRERQRLHDLFFREQLEYPTYAWQEAVVNAIAHRDYGVTGLSSEVWMFEDRLEVRSPGMLPEPVTLERLRNRERVHASRNPLIVRVLSDLGYMREVGEGIPRMFEEMDRNGLYPPELAIEAGALFTVRLRNQPVYSAADLAWLDRYADRGLTPNAKRILLFARGHGLAFTSQDYQRVCGLDRDTAYREIRELIRKGVVGLPQRGRRVYQVLEKPGKAALPTPEVFERLRPVLQRRGFVTNRDIREAMGISRQHAARVAQALQELGLLRIEGRGRGTRYLAVARK